MFTILFAIMESKSKKHRKEIGLPGRTKGSDISLYIGLVLDVFCFIIIFMCLYENGMIKL
jgi:hypothetical protein